ncbi:P-loop containing nucleoside triphosphate hydrolase protein [Umbelopsis sp. AD052]|nr:P-loop containing nucleoside triphosphate hydrolase protein [Umbelopsis sp. AD052]
MAKVGNEEPSKNLLRRRKVIVVESDSEDEAVSTDEGSSDAASDVDFADDGQMENDKQTVDFFNESTYQDIQDVTACTIEQAETIVDELRPFQDMDDLQRKLKKTKGLGERFINAHREMMQGYSAVDKLIDDIEKIGTRIEDVMQIWNQKEQNGEDQPASDDAMLKVAMDGYLHRQPDMMSSEITLKGYQVFGVNWILLLYRMKLSGILADEMGLGKTAQVIGFLAQLVSQGSTGPHLVVVPSSTLENWLREFQKFCPSLDVRSYFGSQVERKRLRYDLREDTTWSILVTTYQMATGAELDRKFLRKLNFDVTILDEGHMVKNCTSARYHHLMAIPSSFRLLLTGTPLQNNLQELVSLLTFILPSMFKGNQEELTKIFKIRQTASNKKEPPKSMQTKAPAGSTNIAQMLSMERIKRAKKIMTPFVLRRQKSQVYTDLPSKVHVLKRCPMSDRQAAVYKKVVEDSKKSLKSHDTKNDDELDIIEANNGMKASEETSVSKPSKAVNILMNLRKAAIHPLLLRSIYTDDILRQMSKAIMREEQYWGSEEKFIFEDMSIMTDFDLHKLCLAHRTIKQWALSMDEIMDSGKVRVLEQLLKEMKEKGDRVLLFSQFTMMLDVLEDVLGHMGFRYSRLDGSSKVDTRQDLIDDFSADPDITVFLLSTKAGGFGINLTAANTVILYDLDPNPHNDKQAEDRAHRVGQARDVTVIRLVSENTVEENIFQMAEVKLRLDQSVSFGRENESDEEDADGEPNLKSLVESALHI